MEEDMWLPEEKSADLSIFSLPFIKKHVDTLIGENQHHRLLRYIVYFTSNIKEYQEKMHKDDFLSLIESILATCVHLDKITFEKDYRNCLACIILEPILFSLEDDAVKKQVTKLICEKIPYGSYGSIPYDFLCGHAASSFNEFITADDNPYRILNDLRNQYLRYSQDNVEQYEEAAILARVIDYWRALKSSSFNIFAESDIVPILELGETILHIALTTSLPSKKTELWRMVLLLQMIIHEHPKIKTLEMKEWPLHGFVNSFKNIVPFEAENTSQSSPISHCKDSPLLKNYHPQLEESRVIFEGISNTEIFSAQIYHSQSVISLLNEMICAIFAVFGPPPCNVAICALGSTARLDRRPYSDLELLVLHSEPDTHLSIDEMKRWEAALAVYIYHVISVLELMIVRLKETPSFKTSKEKHLAGFHLDSSCHVLMRNSKNKMKWGTPKQMVDRFFHEPPLEVLASSRDLSHPWKNDPNFFALLQPTLLHPSSNGADRLVRDYRAVLITYLDDKVCPLDRVGVLSQQLALSEQWTKGLTRRQAIAIASLYDIVENSLRGLQNLQVGKMVNIKDIYYKPLAYCILCLDLYKRGDVNVNKAFNPQQLIRELCWSLPWAGEALGVWWESALAYVATQQVQLHLNTRGVSKNNSDYSGSGHQEEEMLYVIDDIWAGFDLIAVGYLLPLQAILRECLIGAMSFDDLPYALLKYYLNTRKSWLDVWKCNGLSRDNLLNHPLLQTLFSYPDETGWSPQMEQLLNSLHSNLSQLSTDANTACRFSGLPAANKKLIYLKEELVRQCFRNGQFVGDPALSSERSQVRKVTMDKKTWYIRVKSGNKEELMGREYLAMMLHLLLGGPPQIALGWPIKLIYSDRDKSYSCYAWISEGIEEESLAKVMLESFEKLKADRLDQDCFSQLFLLSYLTCPEDGQPENFKVHDSNGKTGLKAIDYGQCFVMSEHMHKSGLFGSEVTTLTVKTMIYFLEAMENPLTKNLITRIRLLNIQAWYLHWKSTMEGINSIFKPLLEEDLRSIPAAEYGKYNRLIDISEAVLLCIKSRLELLQHWLRTVQTTPTGQVVLESLDPIVASQYAALKPKIRTPNDFYQKLDAKAYVKDLRSGKLVSSATFTSLRQQTLTPRQLARSCNLEPNYFRRVNFRQLDELQQKHHLLLLEAVAETKGQAFTRLKLSGCAIEEDRLILLLEKMPELQELDLRHCEGIEVKTVAKLLAHRPKATAFTYNYDVLCPKLQIIKVKVYDTKRTLRLHITFLQRQLLTKKLRVLMRLFDRIVRTLLQRMNHSSSLVHLRVSKALGWYNKSDDPLITILLKELRNYGDDICVSVVKTLGQIGKADDHVRQVLLKALGNTDSDVRIIATQTLCRLGITDDRIKEGLLKSLKDPNSDVRKQAAVALGRLEETDIRVKRELLKALENPVSNVHAPSAADLRRKEIKKAAIDWRIGGHKNSLSIIKRTIQNSEEREYMSPGFIEIFLKALKSSKSDTRASAALVLGLIDSSSIQVRESLVDALKDSSSYVVGNAAIALSLRRDDNYRVRMGLKEAQNHPNICVRLIANDTLDSLSEDDDRSWLDCIMNIGGAALFHMNLIRTINYQIIEELLRELNDTSSFFQFTALEMLSLILTPEICWILIQREIQDLPVVIPTLSDHCNHGKIIKRLFFFVDAPTQRKLPQVCRKWRDLYAEFKDEQKLQSAPELRMQASFASPHNRMNIAFFGNNDARQTTSTEEGSQASQVDSLDFREYK